MQDLLAEVSIDNLLKFTAGIAAYERTAGSEEEYAAFLYIREQLNSFGAITDLQKHDAFISVPLNADLQVDGEAFPCQTHSMAPSTSPAGVAAALSYGGKASELSVSTCEGKIVLIEGRAEREPLIKAASLGAVGVICISGDYIYESCVSPIWGSPSHLNKHLLPAIPVVSVTVSTGKRLKELIADDKADCKLFTQVDSAWRTIPLLTAEFKAPTATDKFVMFSGHVDSWYHGAMDNGTANAVMMEVGRLAMTRQSSLQYNLRLVFFSGHSQGRYAGSAWYCDNHWEDIHYNCVVSVNIDSPGAIGANDITRSTIMPEAKPLALQIIKEQTGIDFVGRRYSRFADQSFWCTGVSCAFASFSKQIIGNQSTVGAFSIPAGGSLDLGWWWHTPADTLDKIDPNNLLRDAKIFTAYIIDFLTAPVIPLDFRISVDEIIAILNDWQSKAAGYFDLSPTVSRANELKIAVESLYLRPRTTPAEIAAFNNRLWQLGRILVPLNYTKGNNYANDPAVAQPPMPHLSAISLLADADNDRRKEIRVELTHSRNYIMHNLNLAIKACNS